MDAGENTLTLTPTSPGASTWRRAVLGRLGQLQRGTLTVEDAGDVLSFGRPAADGLAARVVVRRPGFWRRLALGGSVGAGESYADGDWDADDLTAVVRLLARNREALSGLDRGLAWLGRPAASLFALLRPNTRAGARRNIADHYDLGNDFFALMLDPTMTYSAAVFDPPEATLEEASRRKLEILCRKLDLGPADHLLEIGSGWGSMAIHAASRHGCRVTTTTISPSQYELARERTRAAGLAGRVTVLLEDYRDLKGEYDKLVSIEMIEAIGHRYFGEFFRRCAARLAPGGRMLLQSITIADRHYARARDEVDFIKRYIFPGCCIPSVSALAQAMAGASDLRIVHLEDIGPHYATTLARWRENLFASLERVRGLGYPESFIRMWEFYLCYCEAGFAERALGDVQMLLAREG